MNIFLFFRNHSLCTKQKPQERILIYFPNNHFKLNQIFLAMISVGANYAQISACKLNFFDGFTNRIREVL